MQLPFFLRLLTETFEEQQQQWHTRFACRRTKRSTVYSSPSLKAKRSILTFEVLVCFYFAWIAPASALSFQRIEGNEEMEQAQGLLQTIAKNCTVADADIKAAKSSEEKNFKQFMWKLELKAFAEAKLQHLSETLAK